MAFEGDELSEPGRYGLHSPESVAAVQTLDLPLRPWLLGALGAAAGLALHFLLHDGGDEVPWRVAGAAFVFSGTIAFSLTFERERRIEAALFALGAGAVLGGIAWHSVWAGDRVANRELAFGAGVVFLALAVPLFQAGFHRRFFATSYGAAHHHAWNDALCLAGAVLFLGVAWLLLWLLDELLGLVGIYVIERAMAEDWFGPMWSGLSLGAALGVLRNNRGVIGALQSVTTLVLALLGVPLAAALLVFLVALAASGGAALWNAIDNTTPILLTCAAACVLIANAIIRDEDAARSTNRMTLGAALVLALGVLPLAVFAAVSMGLRIDQYGLAPERLWALVTIGVSVAFGLAYWVAVARGRLAGQVASWSVLMREANLQLSAGVCMLALLLALPLADFGAISAKNQVARLAAGAVSIDDFDYAALRWDFGEAGRVALAQMTRGKGRRAQLAAAALAREERLSGLLEPGERKRLSARLQIENADPRIERIVRDYLAGAPWRCPEPGCTALVVGTMGTKSHVAQVSEAGVTHLLIEPDGEVNEAGVLDGVIASQYDLFTRRAPPPGRAIELRPYQGRQVYVDGRPVGEPFSEPVIRVDPANPLDAPPAPR